MANKAKQKKTNKKSNPRLGKAHDPFMPYFLKVLQLRLSPEASARENKDEKKKKAES